MHDYRKNLVCKIISGQGIEFWQTKLRASGSFSCARDSVSVMRECRLRSGTPFTEFVADLRGLW